MKFEYTYVVMDIQYPDKHFDKLNELGSEGWDAISATQPFSERTIFILLKRSVPTHDVKYVEGVGLFLTERSLPEDGN